MTSQAASDRLGPADFTFSFNCLGEIPLADRFAAARAAGFEEVGLSVRWMREWLVEHELCPVFVGWADSDATAPDPQEVVR